MIPRCFTRPDSRDSTTALSVVQFFQFNRGNCLAVWGLVTWLLLSLSPAARGNVYATNIRLYGSIPSSANSATVFVPCDVMQISYLLNEPATAGVTMEILTGTGVVRTFNLAAGNPGTEKGLNLVVWDVKDGLGNVVSNGLYTVRITAAANGYGDWTQINDDADAYVYAPRGIAVNRNTNSLYYGRVFVGNAFPGYFPETDPGDAVGIQVFNADSSSAGWGSFSTGGWPWSGNDVSPWKIEVSEDNYVYINDWSDHGTVLRFDQNLSAASRILVLRSDNRPNSGAANLSGPFISGSGMTTKVWMADTNSVGSVGIRLWAATNNGAIATNDLGTTVVEAGTNSDLSLAPFDVAVDRSNRIYAVQYTETIADPAYRVMRFPNYEGAGMPLTNADWRIGSGDDNMRGAQGIAVDPTATYVAVAFRGDGFSGGAVRIFSAANGADVRTLTPAPYHEHTDVAWDNVGNLYLCNYLLSAWQVYSPPGANQSTTYAVQTLQVGDPPLAPVLQAVGASSGQFFFSLGGKTNIDYIVESTTNFTSWSPVATNSDPCATRLIAVGATESWQFFRAFPARTP